jgi:hypothetical protein
MSNPMFGAAPVGRQRTVVADDDRAGRFRRLDAET